jgi:sirohydrochlorin cobaltochelatase
MRGIVLIGHGSLKSASGASMIRMAARLRERGIAPIVEAGFLNYSRPTLTETVEKVVDAGATLVTVQPYFLIDGVYVRSDLRDEVVQLAGRFPQVLFHISDSFGAHPLLADLSLDRIREADPALGTEKQPAALLLIAHGTPIPEANAPLEQILASVHARTGYRLSQVAYLDCNEPTIPEAIDLLAAAEIQQIIALPYFLQFGRHVRVDLPQLIEEGRRRHPHVEIRLAHHLDYDLRLADVIADRVGVWDKVTG